MLHSHPAQCARPELGGNWIYGEYTVNEIVKVDEIQKKWVMVLGQYFKF